MFRCSLDIYVWQKGLIERELPTAVRPVVYYEAFPISSYPVRGPPGHPSIHSFHYNTDVIVSPFYPFPPFISLAK
jgi:hypothetical protein